MNIRKIKSDYHFIFFIILFFFIYGYHKSTFKGPYSVHQWRQADCLSITYNYYKYDLSFLEPSINWIGNDGHGRVISEFPIIYYAVAQLWKIFGQHESIFRWIDFLIVFLGLFYLYKTFKLVLVDNFWSVIGVLFLFTSPILVYYSNNFIANAPAFGLVLIALHFMLKYYNQKKINYLYIGSLFFLLAGLLKVTALLSFVAIVPLHLYSIFNSDEKNKNRFYSIIPFAIVFLGIVAWYWYAKNYNQQNLTGIFLQGILPIWDLEGNEIREITSILHLKMMPLYFNPNLLFLAFLAFIFTLVHYKNVHKGLFFLSIGCFLGAALYIVLFFQVFIDYHDYYLINLLIIIPLVFVTFFDLLKKLQPNIFNSKSAKVIAVSALVLVLYNTTIIQTIKYNHRNPMVESSFVIDEESQIYWDWYHRDYDRTLDALESIDPYLTELGINHDDLVISIPDRSINISLYFLKRRGISEFPFVENQYKERIEKGINLGAKYLIINDSAMYRKDALQPFLKNKIGTYRNVDIFKIAEQIEN